MALFRSAGGVPLFIVMSSNRARYGMMASSPSFRIYPGMPSDPIDLYFPIAAILFLMILVSVIKGSPELAHCMLDVTFDAEYRRIVIIKRISLFYRIYNETTITIFNGKSIFPTPFTPFYVLV
jgi:hypothetical protein